MSKMKLNVKNWKGGDIMDDCMSFLTYLSSFAIFILAIISMYHKSTSLLGVLLLYLVNFIYSILFAKDIFSSEKSNTNTVISFMLIAILFLNITSSTIIVMTLRNLHVNYMKNNETIQLSDKSRNLISLYLTLWVSTIVMLWVLFAFYFIEPISEPFFNYMFIGQEFSPLFVFFGLLLKFAFSFLSLGISGYMVYLAKMFSDIKSKGLD